MRILVYWHDMLLPHSAYLVKAFDECPFVEESVLLGPRSSTTEAIFNQHNKDGAVLRKTKLIQVKTYPGRPLWCRFSEYIKYITECQPDLIIILDEALSMNVLLAGLANKKTARTAKVLFYGFENIYSAMPFGFLREKPNAIGFVTFLRKTIRFWLLDKALMPLRRRWIYGGLTAYQECTAFIHHYHWYPVIKEQWWPINITTFSHLSDPQAIRLPLPLAPGQRVLSFVGRFVKEKGIDDLINATALLPDSYQLVLIGAGEEQKAIEAAIEERKLGHRIHIIPPLNQSDLVAYLHCIDLLVLPSRTDYFWKEQYGRVLVEAMASQTLVLGSDSGAIPYVIGDPNFVVKERDISALAQKIEEIFAKQWHKDNRLLKRNQDRSLQADPQVFIKACCDL